MSLDVVLGSRIKPLIVEPIRAEILLDFRDVLERADYWAARCQGASFEISPRGVSIEQMMEYRNRRWVDRFFEDWAGVPKP